MRMEELDLKIYVRSATNLPNKLTLDDFISHMTSADLRYYNEVTSDILESGLSSALRNLNLSSFNLPSGYRLRDLSIRTWANKLYRSSETYYFIEITGIVDLYTVAIRQFNVEVFDDFKIAKTYDITVDDATGDYEITSNDASKYRQFLSIAKKLEQSSNQTYIDTQLTSNGYAVGYCKSKDQIDELADELLNSGRPKSNKKISKRDWPIKQSTIRSDASNFLLDTPGIKYTNISFESDSDISEEDFVSGNYADGDSVRISIDAVYNGNVSSFDLEYMWEESENEWINIEQSIDRSDWTYDILEELGL